MKNIGLLFSFVVLVVAAVGCKSTTATLPPVTSTEATERVVTQVLKDTVFLTKKDSSFYKAYIECVNGKPVFKDIEKTNGRKLKAPDVNLNGNELTVDCYAEAEKLFAQWKEEHSESSIIKTIRIPYPVVTEKPFTQFQVVQLWLGRILLLILLFFVLKWAARKYLKFI